jgi:hypothetical protein
MHVGSGRQRGWCSWQRGRCPEVTRVHCWYACSRAPRTRRSLAPCTGSD